MSHFPTLFYSANSITVPQDILRSTGHCNKAHPQLGRIGVQGPERRATTSNGWSDGYNGYMHTHAVRWRNEIPKQMRRLATGQSLAQICSHCRFYSKRTSNKIVNPLAHCTINVVVVVVVFVVLHLSCVSIKSRTEPIHVKCLKPHALHNPHTSTFI